MHHEEITLIYKELLNHLFLDHFPFELLTVDNDLYLLLQYFQVLIAIHLQQKEVYQLLLQFHLQVQYKLKFHLRPHQELIQ